MLIAIFDAEEPPYFLTDGMGSVRFFHDHLSEDGVKAAIIMDLVGHDVLVPLSYIKSGGWFGKMARLFPRQNGQDIAFPRLRNMLFMTGAESHSSLPELVDQTILPRGLRMIPTLNRYIGDMSDQAVFRQHDVPYLFLSCGRWPYYHTVDDTPEKLNYRKMGRIATYLERLARQLTNAPLPESTGPRDDRATVPFEIRHLTKAVGMPLPLLLKYLGAGDLKTREDLDDLVSTLLMLGL